ncbi:hypothetical protein Efla_007205 [Eimeria flavescens]
MERMPKKKRSGCPASGGTCASISSCEKSFPFVQRNGVKPTAHGRNAFSATNKPTPVSSARHVKISSISAPSRTQLHLHKLPGTPVPTISAPLMNTNSLISSPKQLVFEGTVNKNLITFLLDVGADHSIMTRALALTNGITVHPLDPPIATTFAKKSSEMIRFGTEPLQLQCQGHRSFVQPPVSEGVSLNLLVGHDWLQKNTLRIDWDHGSLMLFDSDQCYKWQAVWASPVFFVTKKNGELRLVMDYSGRNSQTQPDKFPLTLIEVLFGKMSKSKEFSRLDLRNGFYPIRMADGDIFKTSSSSPVCLFEWTVMPMVLVNASASIQRVTSELLKDLQFVQVYKDEIVVHSTT